MATSEPGPSASALARPSQPAASSEASQEDPHSKAVGAQQHDHTPAQAVPQQAEQQPQEAGVKLQPAQAAGGVSGGEPRAPRRMLREDDNHIVVKGIAYTKLELVGKGGSCKVFKVRFLFFLLLVEEMVS